jgi:outer membrane protein assembly factor BamB
VSLGRPVHNRSAVVPLTIVGTRLFVGTENGEVHSIDGRTGTLSWSRDAFSGSAPLPGTGVQAPPAVLLKDFGGSNDLVVVGTNNVSNQLVALDPTTGTTISSLPHAMMGAAKGMPVLDYAVNRAYFATNSGAGTIFAVDLGSPAPNLTLAPLVWNPKPLSSSANGALVSRGGRLYVSTADGKVHSLRLADGNLNSLDLGNGEVKSFMFPDRRNGMLYMSTNNNVVAVRDDPEPMAPNLNVSWTVDDIPTPSPALLRPGTNFLYVGGGDGRLYEINIADADPELTKKWVLLEAGVQVGAPSLDITHNHVVVGSTNGVVRAVRVPLP